MCVAIVRLGYHASTPVFGSPCVPNDDAKADQRIRDAIDDATEPTGNDEDMLYNISIYEGLAQPAPAQLNRDITSDSHEDLDVRLAAGGGGEKSPDPDLGQ